MIHFAEAYPLAVCGTGLAGSFDASTANAFAHVSCPRCREWLRAHRLRPGGFQDPKEWSVQRTEPVRERIVAGGAR